MISIRPTIKFNLLLQLLLLLNISHASVEEALPAKAVSEFVTAMEQIKRNYVFEQNDPELIEAAIRGMVTSLDPYSRYLNAEELAKFESSNSAKNTMTKVWNIERMVSGIVYIDINFFHFSLAKYVDDALKNSNLEKGIIIDLRNNGGGFVDSAVALADLFLDSKLVVHTRGRSAAASRYLSANEKTPYQDIPIIVITDEGTASAAEIFAAAIQDHKRGLIVGKYTYGKGSVQSLIYTQFGAIQITTSMNYRPSGTSIQGEGIRPDVDLTQPESININIEPSSLEKALIEESHRRFHISENIPN